MSAAFSQQFERSVASPLQEVRAPRAVIDGTAVLARYAGGVDAGDMSGAEMFAAIATIKKEEGHKGEALEASAANGARE